MVENSGHYISVEHARQGGGFEVCLHGRHLGRLFALAARATHAEAVLAAADEAERRGGLEVEDRVEGGNG